MNFLDAHKIVHEFGSAVARGAPDKYCLVFRPISYVPFPFDKDVITQAFMLFYAHMFFFKTRTQAEYQVYETLRRTINHFIPDEELDEIRYTVKLATSNNIFDRIFKGKDREFANKRYFNLLEKTTEIRGYHSDDVESYCTLMLSHNKRCEAELQNKPGDADVYFELLGGYCKLAYDTAQIPFSEDYYNFFLSFDMLRKWISQSEYPAYFKKYSAYISENK